MFALTNPIFPRSGERQAIGRRCMMQQEILALLIHNREMKTMEITAALKSTPQHVHRSLSQLWKHGMVRKRRIPPRSRAGAEMKWSL